MFFFFFFNSSLLVDEVCVGHNTEEGALYMELSFPGTKRHVSASTETKVYFLKYKTM